VCSQIYKRMFRDLYFIFGWWPDDQRRAPGLLQLSIDGCQFICSKTKSLKKMHWTLYRSHGRWLIAIITLREMNAQHYRYTVWQYVAAVWNEGFFPKFLKEVGPLARILSINYLKCRLFHSIFIKVLLKWQPMKCLGRDVTNLNFFKFQKWKRTHRTSQNFHVCFHFLKKQFAKKEQTHSVEHGNLTDIT
jgi:hypothetical protein